jgi:DNA repair protein RadC
MTKIKDISQQDRPREKLEKYGAEKLSDAELLAILLRTGTKDLNVIELAKKVLQKYKAKEVSSVTVEQLKDIHGLGTAKACEIVACFELGRRMLKDKPSIVHLTAKDVWERMADVRASKKEHFVVFYLDSRNKENERAIISVGTLNASLVHPREVFELAIQHSARGIILSHNHPSGDPTPSQEDLDITRKLVSAGEILGISVLDHVIVTKDAWRSMKNDVTFQQ